MSARPTSTCIVVLGMHRSGTSAVTRVMNLMGAELPKGLLGNRPSNEAGHWEVRSLLALHEAMLVEAGSRWDDWRAFDPSSLGVERRRYYEDEIARLIAKEYGDAPLFVIKDPRMCRFVPLYETILAEAGVKACYVLPQRNPLAVIASLSVRDGLTKGFAGLLWLRHVLDAEAATRDRPRIIVSYESLLDDWRGAVSDIGKTLEIDWPRGVATAAREIDAHISHDLQHHAPQRTDLDRDAEVPGWTKQTYAAVLKLTGGVPAADALATLDRVRGEFDSAASVFGPAFFPDIAAPEWGFDNFWNHVREIGTDQDHRSGRRAVAATPKTDIEADLRNLEDKLSVATQAKEQSDRALAERGERVEAQELRANALEADLAKRENRNKDLTAKLRSQAAKAHAIEAKLKKAELVVQELRNSTSWRVTAPLRAVATALQGRRQYAAPARLFRRRGRDKVAETIRYRATDFAYYVWSLLPFSSNQREWIKRLLFTRLPIVFNGTGPYLAWIEKAQERRQLLGSAGPQAGKPPTTASPTSLASRAIDWNRRSGRGAPNGITIVTPTGDRVAAFTRCIQWVSTQTIKPDQWIIVDDGRVPLIETYAFPEWVTYIHRPRKASDPPHTLSTNLLAAIPHIRNERIFIFEDDDWYSREHIEKLLPYLDNVELAGANLITYYHLSRNAWKTGRPKRHTALAQTACTRRALQRLEAVCQSDHWEVRERGSVDRHWWHSYEGSKQLIPAHPRTQLGLKGLFGRPGLAEGHELAASGYSVDNDLEFLKETLGTDVSYYGQWAASAARKPWVIYTAIAGGYDSLREPLHDNPLFDHIVFSDEPVKSDRWQWVPFDELMAEPVRTAKKPKILPHLVMPQYEWSIWVDANIFISGELTDYISSCINTNSTVGMFQHPERETALQEAGVCIESGRDNIPTITAQMDRYKTDGFDFGSPLYECNFIVRRHNDPACVALMNRWWREIETGSRRDQLALPYAAWRTGTAVHSLAPKGVSARTVGNLFYSRHGDVTAGEYLERIAQHSARYRKYGSAA